MKQMHISKFDTEQTVSPRGKHFTQVDVQQEFEKQISRLADEIQEHRVSGFLKFDISAETLWMIEALGFVVDFETGIVCREVGESNQVGQYQMEMFG